LQLFNLVSGNIFILSYNYIYKGGIGMSTLAYAQLTTKREASPPNTSTSQSPPGVNTYVDALAALVPSEVLTLHAVILSVTTTIDAKNKVTTISDPPTLAWAFIGLLLVSIGLYVVPRILAKKWDQLDWIRMLIPPLALVGWTMLQRSTAFDAVLVVCPNSILAGPGAARTVIALFLAVILGAVATSLAYKADQKP
jgi:hypothetical protein